MSSVESELSTDILKKKELFIFEFVAFECKLELKNTTWIADFIHKKYYHFVLDSISKLPVYEEQDICVLCYAYFDD